jgi:hypothetical protein
MEIAPIESTHRLPTWSVTTVNKELMTASPRSVRVMKSPIRSSEKPRLDRKWTRTKNEAP